MVVQDCDVYIGRRIARGGWDLPASKWANPFSVAQCNGSAEEAVKRYRAYLMSRPDLMACVATELRGRVLGCWCKPGPCHGDVLAELAEAGNVFSPSLCAKLSVLRSESGPAAMQLLASLGPTEEEPDVFDDEGCVSIHWSDRRIFCDIRPKDAWDKAYRIEQVTFSDGTFSSSPIFTDSANEARQTLRALLDSTPGANPLPS